MFCSGLDCKFKIFFLGTKILERISYGECDGVFAEGQHTVAQKVDCSEGCVEAGGESADVVFAADAEGDVTSFLDSVVAEEGVWNACASDVLGVGTAPIAPDGFEAGEEREVPAGRGLEEYAEVEGDAECGFFNLWFDGMGLARGGVEGEGDWVLAVVSVGQGEAGGEEEVVDQGEMPTEVEATAGSGEVDFLGVLGFGPVAGDVDCGAEGDFKVRGAEEGVDVANGGGRRADSGRKDERSEQREG